MINYERLQQLIASEGKTKTYLCKKLGKASYFLRDAQNTNQNLPDEYIQILARELNTTVEYLTNQTDFPGIVHTSFAVTSDEEKILSLFRNLSESDQKRAVTILEGLCN